jgi:hypothetical protein
VHTIEIHLTLGHPKLLVDAHQWLSWLFTSQEIFHFDIESIYTRKTICDLARSRLKLGSSGAGAGRKVGILGTPVALLTTQGEFERTTIGKEAMVDPILGVRLTIECRLLDVDILVIGIKIDVADRCGLASLRIGQGDRGKEGRRNEVHILTRVREDAHHYQGTERSHGAAIVISWNAGDGVVELAWNVVVSTFSRKSGSASEMVEEDIQECSRNSLAEELNQFMNSGRYLLFITDVEEATFMEEVKSLDECICTTEGLDQCSHVLWHEESVEPR